MGIMRTDTLGQLMKDLRESSRWPEQEAFARALGITEPAYRKYEAGYRQPNAQTIELLCELLHLKGRRAKELWDAWHREVETPVQNRPGTDLDALSKRIESEIRFILKQAEIKVPSRLGRVIRNRVGMIVKAALEV